MLIPKVFALIKTSSIKLDQNRGFKLNIYEAWLNNSYMFSIRGSFSFIIGDICSAKTNGDFLFNFERTIATFVEISQSNFVGGISALFH